MVTNPIPFHILVVHLLAGDGFNHVKGFEDRARISPTAPEVVHFPRSGIVDVAFDSPGYVKAVNVIPDLFSLVSEYLVHASRHVNLDQVVEKTVQLDPGMVWPGKTSAPVADGLHTKVFSVLLDHDVRSDF